MAGYFFLHSWLNLWGEILQFADREFYSVSLIIINYIILIIIINCDVGLVDMYIILCFLSQVESCSS